MKKYDIIAFDLDGTLSNPERGLVAGFQYAFDKMGIEYGTKESLKRFIGPPLFDEWKKCFGLSDEICAETLRIFREYYDVYGWRENELYKGVKEMLAELKTAGKILLIATSKPEKVANKVLHFFDIAKYFDFISTATIDKKRDKKREVLVYALSSVPGCDKSKCLMVGDRVFDAVGAKEVGIDSMGVLYGHGSREEIESSGFNYVVENVSDISKLILS